MKFRYFIRYILSIPLLLAVALPVFANDDIEKHRSCAHCGMDRKAYGYSRMLVVYTDGNQTGVCSLHCAVIEMTVNPANKVKSLLVADRDSHQLTDAENAFWVLGGSKRGVMTARPKWAFAIKEAAMKFIGTFGGSLVSWEQALAAGKEDAKL
jgi:nitrous oxide reductase accessory protein NosL